jgi:hypothetical protein
VNRGEYAPLRGDVRLQLRGRGDGFLDLCAPPGGERSVGERG